MDSVGKNCNPHPRVIKSAVTLTIKVKEKLNPRKVNQIIADSSPVSQENDTLKGNRRAVDLIDDVPIFERNKSAKFLYEETAPTPHLKLEIKKYTSYFDVPITFGPEDCDFALWGIIRKKRVGYSTKGKGGMLVVDKKAHWNEGGSGNQLANGLKDLNWNMLDVVEVRIDGNVKVGVRMLLTAQSPCTNWLTGSAMVTLQVKETIGQPMLKGFAYFYRATIFTPILRKAFTKLGIIILMDSNKVFIRHLESGTSRKGEVLKSRTSKKGKLSVHCNLPLRTTEVSLADKVDVNREVLEVRARNNLKFQFYPCEPANWSSIQDHEEDLTKSRPVQAFENYRSKFHATYMPEVASNYTHTPVEQPNQRLWDMAGELEYALELLTTTEGYEDHGGSNDQKSLGRKLVSNTKEGLMFENIEGEQQKQTEVSKGRIRGSLCLPP